MQSVNAQQTDWLWDDIRFFWPSAGKAVSPRLQRNLGVDHSTVGRRLAEFERQLGARLTNRTRNGVLLTPTGRQILSDCENMEAAAQTVQRRAAGQDALSAGLVSLATTDTLAFQLIIPALGNFVLLTRNFRSMC